MRSIASVPERRKAAVLLAAVLLPASLLATAADPPAGRVGSTETELNKLRDQMQELDADLKSGAQKRDALQKDLEQSEREIQAAVARKREADAAVERQKRAVEAAEQEYQRAEQRLQEDRALLRRDLRSFHRAGATNRARVLLSVDDVHAAERMLVYYDYYAASRADGLKALRAQLEALEVARQQLAADLAELEVQRKKQAAALAALLAARNTRGQTLTQLKEKLSDGSEKLQQMKSEEQALRKLLEQLRAAARAAPKTAKTDASLTRFRGKLPWPLRGKLLANYGEAKAGGKMTWNGLWIAAPEGAPVRTVAEGTVAYVGWLQRFGQIIIVDHDGSYLTLYGHNQSVSHQVGDRVSAGDVIAAAGNSGGHEETGVYFEIRKGATPVDPRGWLAPN
jgi:septal ring factor EnvC (AmiA/AmiB activator)